MTQNIVMAQQDQSHEFVLHRNADIDLRSVMDGDGHRCAEITVNDKFIHRFSHTSRVSKHLESCTVDQLRDRLQGGQYFEVDGHLVDWRMGDYQNFVHDDDGLNALATIVGFQHVDEMPLHRSRTMNRRIRLSTGDVSPVTMSRIVTDHEIIVPGMGDANEFNSQISVSWSPFQRHVDLSFDLIRMICTNGMVGMASWVSTKVPVQNRWQEHIAMASTQLGNKVDARVSQRIADMRHERASLADVMLLTRHTSERITALDNRMPSEQVDMSRLHNIHAALDPMAHLGDVYRENVFTSGALQAKLPSHLTASDVFNIATELATHTNAGGSSTDAGLHKLANRLLFDGETQDMRMGAHAGGEAHLADFSNAEAAFWGK